ncbi:hypothetical protein ABZ915_27085 [Streptomyces sp. NPDC046915]|uniref:hypothetical protein n=1 Tax=Streptomyces sp. NPDC046915 TaxID=3155257 RepID=UPI0033F8CF14
MNNHTGGMEGTVAMNITACSSGDTTSWSEAITESDAGDKVGVFGAEVKTSGPDTVSLGPNQRVMSTRIDLKQCLPIPVDVVSDACGDWASWQVQHTMTKTPDGNVTYQEQITPLSVNGRDPDTWPQNTWRIDAE